MTELPNMSRRAVIAAPIALAVAGGVLAKAFAETPMDATAVGEISGLAVAPQNILTSWFGKIPDTFGALRVGYAGPGNLSVNVHPHVGSSAKEFDSFRALIDEVFDTINPTTISKETAGDATTAYLAVQRAANQIACCTRRGAGNCVFIHYATIFNMDEIRKFEGFTVVPVAFIEPDELLIIYEGSRPGTEFSLGPPKRMNLQINSYLLDGPFIAEILPDGRVKAVILTNEKSTLGNAGDFGRFIKAV